MAAAPTRPAPPAVIVVMGVSGCGKTTVGQLLATELCGAFADADAFHPPENRERMREGIPLTDADRAGWLQVLGTLIRNRRGDSRPLVLACSALRAAYRDVLIHSAAESAQAIRFVYLRGNKALIRARLDARQGHFMPSGLLDSQFATLEEPTDAVVLDVSKSPETLSREAARALLNGADTDATAARP